MTGGIEARATRLGVVAAVVLLGLVVVLGFLTNASTRPERSSARPIATDNEPLPGGTKTSLAMASEQFVVPLYRPDTPLASDTTVSEMWMRLNDAPEVWIQYRSGIVVVVRPIGQLLPTAAYAEAMTAQGISGRIAAVEGVDAFIVPQSEAGSGSVRLVLDDVLVDVIGFAGDFSEEDLTDAAASVVDTSGKVAAEFAR